MSELPGPTDEANEADVAEQHQSVAGEEVTVSEPRVPSDQADEADVLEQGAEVANDEDEDYPRG